MTHVCNFADSTRFYVCDKDLNALINRLEHDTALAVEWFKNDFMTLNQNVSVICLFLDINMKLFSKNR